MPKEKPRVNIGAVIKTYRSQRGLSQGDIERRTGLLRCYLSRVENRHTVPSLETLAKIAEAMDISLADFFPGTETPRDRETQKALGGLSQDEIRFLAEIKKYSTTLSDGDKRLVLAMIRKLATLIPPPVPKKLIVRRPTALPTGTSEHRNSPRGRRRIRAPGNALFDWKRLFGHAALGAKGFFPRKNSFSPPARGHQLQIPRDDRVPRLLSAADRRGAHRSQESGGARCRRKSLFARHPKMLRPAKNEVAPGRTSRGCLRRGVWRGAPRRREVTRQRAHLFLPRFPGPVGPEK